ncbi:hypothetical protein [Burkholderia sp. LMG 21824]|uniref:hypothetical protein n=1 Tax=Burkholderia sp. LMG 21824 TaxID=3158172 RepID=UPI003C2B3C59
MKNKTRSGILKLSLSIAIALSLSACNDDSKPSAEEAQKAVVSNIGECSFVDMQDFKKLNGIQQQDGSYLVYVSYKLVIHPTDEIKDYLTANNMSSYKGALQIAQNADAEIQQRIDQEDAVRDQWKAENPNGSDSDFRQSIGMDAANQSNYDHMHRGTNVAKAYMEASQYIYQQMHQGCPQTVQVVWEHLDIAHMKPEDFAQDHTLTMNHGQIHMIKTDNGWMEARDNH